MLRLRDMFAGLWSSQEIVVPTAEVFHFDEAASATLQKIEADCLSEWVADENVLERLEQLIAAHVPFSDRSKKQELHGTDADRVAKIFTTILSRSGIVEQKNVHDLRSENTSVRIRQFFEDDFPESLKGLHLACTDGWDRTAATIAHEVSKSSVAYLPSGEWPGMPSVAEEGVAAPDITEAVS